MSNQDVKKMASLLHKGATMLDSYCPKCGKILFKLPDGMIFCPACEKEVKIISNNSKNQTYENTIDITPTYIEMNNLLTNKISNLFEILKTASDMDYIKKILENIEKILEIIQKLNVIQDNNK